MISCNLGRRPCRTWCGHARARHELGGKQTVAPARNDGEVATDNDRVGGRGARGRPAPVASVRGQEQDRIRRLERRRPTVRSSRASSIESGSSTCSPGAPCRSRAMPPRRRTTARRSVCSETDPLRFVARRRRRASSSRTPRTTRWSRARHSSGSSARRAGRELRWYDSVTSRSNRLGRILSSGFERLRPRASEPRLAILCDRGNERPRRPAASVDAPRGPLHGYGVVEKLRGLVRASSTSPRAPSTRRSTGSRPQACSRAAGRRRQDDVGASTH